MHKYLLLITFITYVPLQVFSDGKLQAMSDIVKNMNTSRLCDYDCKPEVTVVNGTNLTVSFTTINAITDDVNTTALCKCMLDYMQGGVGDAKSECKSCKKKFAIIFHGDYDPNARPLPPLTTLANVLSNYETPDLGGYKCSQEIKETDGRISIKLVYSGKDYKSACDGILNYLNQNNFLEGASHDCTVNDKCQKVILDLWDNGKQEAKY